MLAVLIAAQLASFNTAPPNDPTQKPAVAGQTRAPGMKANVAFEVTTVAKGLENPWGMTFLPGGEMLVTERPGRLRIVARDGSLSKPVSGLLPLVAAGQGGLLDVALDPLYAKNGLIYWSYSEPQPDGTNNTAVARGQLVLGDAPSIQGATRIFSQSPSLDSRLHFGGRLVFANDGTLFITTGDRSIIPGRVQAQRSDGLIGKIVRINSDGSIPKNNPYANERGTRSEIWSRGHRNVQGAVLHPKTGALWEVEHGTRGGDELNIVRKGKDYGWPTIAYGIEYNGKPITGGIQAKAGMEQPLYYWDPIIAPSGLTFYTGDMFPAWKDSLFVGGLRSTALIRLTLRGEKVVGEERLLTDLKERIRDVRQGPDGALYLLTDNAEGRVLKVSSK